MRHIPDVPNYLIVWFRSSYKEVHVRLGDMNDHLPVFNREEYEVRVLESALVNTPLTRFKVSLAVNSYLQDLSHYVGFVNFNPLLCQ